MLGGGVSERQFEINICGFEGSQAVSASPSGRGEACIRDLFNFHFLGKMVVRPKHVADNLNKLANNY
jgi:hypothetical protein